MLLLLQTVLQPRQFVAASGRKITKRSWDLFGALPMPSGSDACYFEPSNRLMRENKANLG